MNTYLTRRDRVLNILKSRHWIPGHELTQPATGGSEGLRRLRELRELGYQIKSRRVVGGSTYEYRMVGRPS